MKLFISCLVMCALLGISQAQYQDSPAVKAAKAAHFEAVRRAETIIANNPGPFNQTRRPVEETTQHKLGLNVHDTPEVAAAKSAHYKALRDAEEATAIANSTAKYPDSLSGVHHQHQQHHVPAVYSPPATPSPTRRPAIVQYQPTPVHHHQSVPIVQQTTQHKLGVNVHETPEVAAARAAHFEALRRAEQAAAVSGPIEYEDTYVMVPSYQKIAPIVPVPIAQPAAVRGGPRFIEPSVPHYGQRAHAVMYVPQTYEQNVQYGQHIEMIPVVTYPQTNQHKLGVNVEDTPEVAAAKKAHFEAFRQAQLAAGSAAFEDEEENSAPRNNYFSNPTRQYGQVNY